MSETFQSVVHGRLEAEAEVIRDLFESGVHQLTGADSEDDGYEGGDLDVGDDDDGYEEDDDSDSDSDDGYADGTHDHAALMDRILGGLKSADGEAEESERDEDHRSRWHKEHGADNGNGTYTVESGDTLSSIAAAHGISTAQLEMGNPNIPDFDLIYPGQIISLPSLAAPVAASATTAAPTGDDGYEEYTPEPAPTQGAAVAAPLGASSTPVYDLPSTPSVPAPAPMTSPSGVTLGDILSVVGETAQATGAVASAFRPQYRPGMPPAFIPAGAPGVSGGFVMGPGFSEGEYGIHEHRMGRFAHEKPVLFILLFAAVMYFLFLSEDSVWEKVLHSGSKSRQHDKVETVTEEIHTRREAVLGKPTFPPSSSAPAAPMSAPSPTLAQ